MERKAFWNNDKLALLVYFLILAILALAGAFFYFPSWYYSLFKVVMVVDACLSFRLYDKMDSSDSKTMLFGVAIVLAFIAFLGIVSQFFVRGGFPKGLWVVLDFMYAIAKAIQYYNLYKTLGDKHETRR